jgi:hypothetical protein
MKQFFLKTVTFCFGLALTGGLIWVAGRAMLLLGDWIGQQKSDIAVGIIAAATTVFVSVVSLIYSKYLEQKASVEQDLRVKKGPMYEKVIESIHAVIMSSKTGKTIPETELIKMFTEMTQELTIWGSDDVVRQFGNFRSLSVSPKGPMDILFTYENLLLAIRKDLGHKNANFQKGCFFDYL